MAMEDYLKITIPTAISLLAAIFSILTYKRNRRLDNENYLYKAKYESYSTILREMSKLLNSLQDYVVEFRVFLVRSRDGGLSDDELIEIENDIEKLADNVDELIFAFDDTIISNSLVIPKELLSKLEQFSEKLIASDLPETDDEKANTLLLKLDKHVSELITSANAISDMLRSDMNIEELNMSLYRRIKS